MPHPIEQHLVSGDRVWKCLAELLKKESSPYLTPDKFVVQKDALLRLFEDDVQGDAPFITYMHHQPTSDSSLRFELEMYRDDFVLAIGPAELNLPYTAFGVLAPQVATNLLTTLKLLLNGQLALGCTLKHGHILAAELFLLGQGARPLGLLLVDHFSLFERAGTDYEVQQNRLLDEKITIPAGFPLLPPKSRGSFINYGRDVDSVHDLPPLTRRELARLTQSIFMQQTVGKPPHQSNWLFLCSRWEFWLTIIAVASTVGFLRLWPGMPAIFREELFGFGLNLAGGIFIFAGSTYLLERRERQQRRTERHAESIKKAKE